MEKGNEHSKQLEDIEKREMFQAPQGYFDQLPDKVFERIAAEEEKKRASTKVVSFHRWWLAAAAATVLLVSTFILIPNNRTEATDYYALLNEVSSEEIVAYLGETDISIAELEMALANDEEINMYDSSSIPDLEEEETEALLEYYSL